MEELKRQHLTSEKMEIVLRNQKTPHEKKIVLFNCLKDIEVEELEPDKKKIDFLI